MRIATATTAEMFGKLNLKVVHGGNASLSSIKVMQPKQVNISLQKNKYFFEDCHLYITY